MVILASSRKMTNENVARSFGNMLSGRATNFYSTGDKAYSYGTVIAQYVDGRVYVNDTRYSNTTRRHQNLIKQCFDETWKVIELKDVPMWTRDLRPFIK